MRPVLRILAEGLFTAMLCSPDQDRKRGYGALISNPALWLGMGNTIERRVFFFGAPRRERRSSTARAGGVARGRSAAEQSRALPVGGEDALPVRVMVNRREPGGAGKERGAHAGEKKEKEKKKKRDEENCREWAERRADEGRSGREHRPP